MKGDNEGIGEDDERDRLLSDDDHQPDPNDVGESTGVGRRGSRGSRGSHRIMASGSFRMASTGANRAGNDEEE